jgi:hypothetical protein
MDFFPRNELRFESNHSSKIKENLLHLNLQTLAKVYPIDNTNISSINVFLEFNSLHVRKLFANGY